MRSKPTTRIAAGLAIALMALGCQDRGAQESAAEGEAEAEGGETMPARVMIVEPADGAVVEEGPVRVVMEVEGLEVVMAGVMDPGTGHHHLVVNGDVDWAAPIPYDPGVHYHMGQAETELTLEDLPPGEHRIISVVADGVHIPLDPPVADTITIVVR